MIRRRRLDDVDRQHPAIESPQISEYEFAFTEGSVINPQSGVGGSRDARGLNGVWSGGATT